MTIHKEKTFLLQPIVLVLIVILLIAVSFTGLSILTFLFSLILSLALLSSMYLRFFQRKITWDFKKYVNSTSIEEETTCFIELENHAALPIHNLKLNIEFNNYNEMVFVNQVDGRKNSMYTLTVDLPAKSQKTIEIKLEGKARGNHKWSAFNLMLSDPLNLQTYRLDYSRTELPRFKVVPRILKVPDLHLKSLLQGHKQTNHSLFLDETSIIGTKDYENESFRHIHWLATAKENKLLAKKYQKVHGDLYSVFLNLVGKGHFHLRKDMEDLIEYTVSVCLNLIKEGCKVELWVNYSTEQKGLLSIKNGTERSQLKKIIESLALLDSNGVFLASSQFYKYGMAQKDEKSLALVIGTPPESAKLYHWLHIKA
ncbi:DUF58 domain-containing protein [Bacillus sp. P14.5]|uniref:DUF58 domain-containing protein n=1 Tax=Bacillus sp. P14.5 TaxID=1983400 RepID=UPI000DEA316E|nr:DUF58 domain-containing protein [Bacillus sp. P14.5]